LNSGRASRRALFEGPVNQTIGYKKGEQSLEAVIGISRSGWHFHTRPNMTAYFLNRQGFFERAAAGSDAD
jgi:hypothetical protein